MKPEIPKALQILQEACQRFDYSWELVDTFANNVVKVSDGKQHFFSSNSTPGLYPLNRHFATAIARDKAWASRILKQNGYTVPEGDYFFVWPDHREKRGDGREYDDAFTYAEKLGYPVFVKPNRGSLGINANMIHDKDQLRALLDAIAKKDYIALIQKPIKQREFRLFVLDGEVIFSYERVANEGSDVANLSQGGAMDNYSEESNEKIKAWGKELTEFLNLRIAGIDVFATDFNDPSTYTIIEVNHNPGISGIYEAGHQEKALDIWKQILEKYFKQ